MQAIFEPIFEILYLVIIFILGVIMIKRSGNNKMYLLFGIMTVILVVGDSFHLIPRMIALWSDDFNKHAISLGIGKLITSITMTIFYIFLYFIWKLRYKVKGSFKLTITLVLLAIARIGLCLMPQNEWTNIDAPLSWGIYRNIPFLVIGIIIITIYAIKIKEKKDTTFKFMPLSIFLSFLFYIPVVLFADIIPMIGMLMIPKTLAYVWIVSMGYRLIKH